MNAMEPDPNDLGCQDLGYWELYTRWLQYACFLPIFRSHGTDAAREIWRFGEEGSPFYDTIARFIRLRYSLLPYLYSLVALVTREGVMMIRALALEFPNDIMTHAITDQYLFGKELLVCPVTRPMYYQRGSQPIDVQDKSRSVYLPSGCDWYDFWTNSVYRGGQQIIANAPLEKMPLFVRAGSILPMTDPMQYVDEISDLPYVITIYSGKDARFVLYEDAGDGYTYERGEFATVAMAWKDAERSFSIGDRAGGFAEMVIERLLYVKLISEGHEQERKIRYAGDEILYVSRHHEVEK